MQPTAVTIPAQSAMPPNEPQFKDKDATSINGFVGLHLTHHNYISFQIVFLDFMVNNVENKALRGELPIEKYRNHYDELNFIITNEI